MARARALSRAQRRAIAQRAAVVRWNRVRAVRGLPLAPLPELALVQTPAAQAIRLRRALGRRMAEHDGVAWTDDLCWRDPRIWSTLAPELERLGVRLHQPPAADVGATLPGRAVAG